MARGHPYQFNLGHGRSFKDYKEAANALMERNMPDVLNDRQTTVVFIPDTHLPKEPRVVDVARGPPKEIQHAKGDLVEKELFQELKKFYSTASDKEVVVYHGPEIRKPGESKAFYQESDFVIVNKNSKSIYNIECKTTLTGIVGKKAIKQSQKLKTILEEFFASELSFKDWCFVGMIYSNTINTFEPPCADCRQFIINGPTEVATKLNNMEALLKTFRPQPVVPSHADYESLVESLAFVVLSQPTSTCCTIANDVHYKVVGKPAMGKKKAMAGQGDFQSIIFWTNEQAKIMLTVLQFVFFISPWSTGKTLLMREKAVMWATQNPTEKLFFVVVRYEHVNQWVSCPVSC